MPNGKVLWLCEHHEKSSGNLTDETSSEDIDTININKNSADDNVVHEKPVRQDSVVGKSILFLVIFKY